MTFHFIRSKVAELARDWNNALSFVETKFATIAHQDDYYEPEYAEKVLSKMEKHPDDLNWLF